MKPAARNLATNGSVNRALILILVENDMCETRVSGTMYAFGLGYRLRLTFLSSSVSARAARINSSLVVLPQGHHLRGLWQATQRWSIVQRSRLRARSLRHLRLWALRLALFASRLSALVFRFFDGVAIVVISEVSIVFSLLH